jgi:hypothetical protein
MGYSEKFCTVACIRVSLFQQMKLLFQKQIFIVRISLFKKISVGIFGSIILI